MTHPFSIFIREPRSKRWFEPVQVYTQEYAIYLANLIHADTKSVLKVVRYGITIAAFPNPKTVERIEK